ncbi:MAG TPA: dCTP deaminase [Candidatus Bilamarchaeaceae archaeon]|nr:dCTP deaminase [Candidatus Bilamarchaeaceae archaeon]
MLFSDRDILRAIRQGRIKITPFQKNQVGPASVDLTLSNEWWVFKEAYQGKTVDLKKTGFHQATRKIRAKSITLQPGEVCLGKTVEKIKLAPDILGMLEGRSRYARMGLSVHITAALVQPGSDNHQILEIVNFAPFSVKLHAGMQVSQVIFHEIQQKTSKPYARFGKIARHQ